MSAGGARPMLTQDFAQRFASDWISAWNAHDLERVLSHYEDDFEMSSPYIARMAGEPSESCTARKPSAHTGARP